MTIDHYKQTDEMDLRQTLDHHANMFFVIHNDEVQPYCSMVVGKLSVQLGFTQQDMITAFPVEIQDAMKGKEVKFRYHFKQRCLCIYPSPIFHNQKVIKLVGTAMDITPYEKAEQTIEYMATHDKLTNKASEPV
ncbi:hypothetical protein MUN88_01670 [Gracilibacillus caseinilyticus]|uniref:PAS domain S-box-containing protein n=1 Tax=Gracilibacillus caseinilyticus TaxID=2932256 RepID=A0ABY4EX63_9BACI|nr:hypothetical protein [Gracilibacillus caseinilyticus]UOQ48874.1 hypothetical protein MUN88_01670 [Gracilibacillus caseinilyticus]